MTDVASLRRKLDRVVIAVFVAVIGASAVDMLARPDSARSTLREQRRPAERPTLDLSLASWWAFAPQCDRWWRDSFGLRDRWIELRNALTLAIFGEVPNEQAILGRQRWLYVINDRALEAELGHAPFDAPTLDAWRRMLDARRAWLARQGVRYLLAFVPGKGLVYPEFAPRGWRRVGESRYEELRASLGPSWSDAYVDLLDSQLRAKALDRPTLDDWSWYPRGSHWATRGAFEGYVEIARRIAAWFPGASPLSRDDFELRATDDEGDSWAGRLYLSERMFGQRDWLLHPRVRLDATSLGEIEGHPRSERWKGGDPKLPRALVFHDSMCPALRPWLSTHFSEVAFHWQANFDAALVLAWRPDVVIELRSDRALVHNAPVLSGAEASAVIATAFEAAPRALFELDAGRDVARCAPIGGVHLERSERGLAIYTVRPSDAVVLPTFDRPGSAAWVRLAIESPHATSGELFYKVDGLTEWNRRASCSFELEAGVNDLYFELAAPGLTGELLLRPARDPGRFVIRWLEVRAAQR